MAFPIPFLAGLALGSAAVLVFNKREQICDKLGVCDNLEKAKDFAKDKFSKTKELFVKSTEQISEKPKKRATKTAKKSTRGRKPRVKKEPEVIEVVNFEG